MWLVLLFLAVSADAHPIFNDAIPFIVEYRGGRGLTRSWALDVLAQNAANYIAESQLVSHDYITKLEKRRLYDQIDGDEDATRLAELLGASSAWLSARELAGFFIPSESHWTKLMDPELDLVGFGLAIGRDGRFYFSIYIGKSKGER